MKKIISIILVAAIMLGFIAMTVSVASAEVLQSVAVTGVTAPVAGQTATTDGLVCADPNVEVTAVWQCLSDGKAGQTFTGVFQDNKAYALVLELSTPNGMEMDRENTAFSIDGHAPDYVKRYWDTRYDIGLVYELGQVQRIDTVVLEQVPQLQVGQSITEEQIFAQFKAAEGLELYDGYIQVWNGEEYETFTEGALEAKRYHMMLEVKGTLENGYLDGLAAELAWPDVPGEFYIESRDPGRARLSVKMDLRTKVEPVQVSGITVPELGKEFTTEGIVVPEGLEYEASWWNSDEDRQVQPGEKMLGSKTYTLQIDVTAKPGYMIAVKDDQVLVNGMTEEDEYDLDVMYVSDTGFTVFWDFYTDLPSITRVQLDGVPAKIQEGAAPALEVTSMHPHVKVTDTQWVDINGDPVTTFAAGKSYALRVRAEVDENFRTAPWGYMYTRDLESDSFNGEEQYMEAFFAYTTAKYAELELTGTGIAVGEKTGDVKFTAPTGAKVLGAEFRDAHTNEQVTSFVSGKNYKISVYLIPEEGYAFRQHSDVTLNGEDAYYSTVYDRQAFAEFYVCFGKKLDKLSVSADEPKVGNDITAPTVPQNADYVVREWYYYDCHTGNSYEEGKFQAGHKYLLTVYLEPKDGSVFDKDAEVLLNGKETDHDYVGDTYAVLEKEYSFAQVLQKVELPAWPSLKVGDALKSTAGEADDQTYFYYGYWQDEDYNEIGVGNKAVSGYLYDYVYQVQAAPGYDITEDTKVFVGGKEMTRGQLAYNGTDCAVEAQKPYPLGLQTVDTVKLEIKEPELGKLAEPEVTLDEDEPYYVDYVYWCRGKTDDAEDAKWMDAKKDTFEYGYYYYLGLVMDTDQGYAFGDKVTVIVNGGELEGYVFSNQGNTLDVYVPTGLFTDNPKTGDESPVIAVAALLVLAMTGLAVTVIGKKRFG